MTRSRELEPDQLLRMVRRVLGTVLLPWRAARFLLKPRGGPSRNDRLLDRIGFWRSVVGLFVIVIVTSPWRSTGDVMASAMGKTQLTAMYAMYTVPLTFLVSLIATRSGRRRRLLAGTPRLLGRAALASVGFLVVFGSVVIFGSQSRAQDEVTYTLPARLGGLAAVGFLWLLIFILCSIYWAARTGFWLGEVHSMLAPVGTTCVMLVIAVQELVEFDTEKVPGPLWLTLNLCGTVSALTLAVVEYRHLWSTGYRFRDGPEPLTTEHPVLPESVETASMELVRLPSNIADRVIQGGPDARDLLDKAKEVPGRWLFVGTYWPAIHFTLSGVQPLTKEQVRAAGLHFRDDRRENILMGGSLVHLEAESSTVRYQRPDEVSRNWRLLSEVTAEKFRRKYDPEALDMEDIPPYGWAADPARKDALAQGFLELRTFFKEAAENGHGIVAEFVPSDD